MNFLYRTAGYLGINYILDREHIEYFFRLVDYVKSHYQNKHSLLHIYPFAAKMVASYSTDKSRYFNNQLKKFSIDTYHTESFNTAKYSLIHALFLENNTEIDKDQVSRIKNRILKNKNKNVQKIKKFICSINKFLGHAFAIKNVFVNENIHIQYDTYENYLDHSILRDVYNNFDNIQKNHHEKALNLYYGAVTDATSNKDQSVKLTRLGKKEYFEKIDNTWSNESYQLGSDQLLAIRLIDINSEVLRKISDYENELRQRTANTIWMKPVGCIVVKYSGDFNDYLKCSRKLLVLQNEIVDFFKTEFSGTAFKEIIHRKQEEKLRIQEEMLRKKEKILSLKSIYDFTKQLKQEKQLRNKMAKEHAWQISKINHSIKEHLRLDPKIEIYLDEKNRELNYETYLRYLGYYLYGMFHLSSLVDAKPKSGLTSKAVDIVHSLNVLYPDSFYKKMKNFIPTAHFFSDKVGKNFTENTLDISALKSNSLVLDLNETIHMSHISFEFIFNAMKHIPSDYDTPFIKFSSLRENTGIVIMNPVQEDFDKAALYERLKDKERVGMAFIHTILAEQGYSMNFKKFQNILYIILRKE